MPFIGIVKIKKGYLLGGVKEHRSIPFAKKEDAESWVEVVYSTNVACGRVPDKRQVLKTRGRV